MLYKDYYYDNDIEMYYLKSRFYNPLFRRFFQIDTIDYLDNSSVVGLNLYSYCKNNPVMFVDENGHSAIVVFGTLISMYELMAIVAVLVGTAAIITVSVLETKYHFLENSLTSLLASLNEIFLEFSPHRKTKNGKGRTRNKHEKGQSRSLMDRNHTERADIVRKPRKDPKKQIIFWILANLRNGDDDEEYWEFFRDLQYLLL